MIQSSNEFMVELLSCRDQHFGPFRRTDAAAKFFTQLAADKHSDPFHLIVKLAASQRRGHGRDVGQRANGAIAADDVHVDIDLQFDRRCIDQNVGRMDRQTGVLGDSIGQAFRGGN